MSSDKWERFHSTETCEARDLEKGEQVITTDGPVTATDDDRLHVVWPDGRVSVEEKESFYERYSPSGKK